MKALKLISLLFFSLMLFSCETENNTDVNLTLEKLSGYVQKGPYLNGTSITILELTDELAQTGKNFSSQILDNSGTFEVDNLSLVSKYVELKADGFYFNEVTNLNSSAQLTLYALSDVSNKSSVNVNILSHLERNRVIYLISTGMSFSEAKSQAQSEILSIFEINPEGISTSEQLDITKSNDEDAMLLAVSVILQGYLSVSDLSELLANISTDIAEDGVLDNQDIGKTLINNAQRLKLSEIRKNLEDRYKSLSLEVVIPDFEKYVNQFINNTDFEFTDNIEYPESGAYGPNILDKNKTDYVAGIHSLNAILPENTSFKVIITGTNWYITTSTLDSCYNVTEWNSADSSRIFTANRTGNVDYRITLANDTSSTHQTNYIKIKVYENNAKEPTWEKEIAVN